MGKATRWIRRLLGMKKKENKRGLSRTPEADSAWLRSFIADSDKEQNKHAIAVAAATAAAADAAVAAAEAAAAVVRLTSQGRGAVFASGRERWAAVKIQTVFRGFLARKALRALKGLVKLQALFRGYLVRKRAAATLHSMLALIRAQSSMRSQRARRITKNERGFQPETRSRKSNETFEETRSEFHSRRLSASYDPSFNASDESPKTVEIDTCRPESRSRRMSTCASVYSEDQYSQSIPDHCTLQGFDFGFIQGDIKFATAQNTPRFSWSGRAKSLATAAKSVSGDSFFRAYSDSPNYMTDTQSFKAKLRSQSAPKRRPEAGPKKELSLNEIMASRNSFRGVRMQRSFAQVHEDL